MPKHFCKTKDLDAFGLDNICSRSDCSYPVKELDLQTSAALTIEDEDTTTLVGITKSKECNYDEDQEVSAYINVAPHMNWIRSYIGGDFCAN